MESRTLLVGLVVLNCCWPGRAAEYFIGPAGSPANNGSINSPWSMAHGLGSANTLVRPGDVVWLRAGTYVSPPGGWPIRLSSADDARPIIVRNYRGERAIIDGGFNVDASNLWLWGLEVTGSGASSSTGYTLSTGRNIKLINSLLYDNQSSGGMSQEALNAEFYGNVIARSGRYDASQIKCYGNSIYTQNRTATVKKITDCVIANGFLEGINIYSGGTTPISHYSVEGNIAFGNGHCHGRNFLVGSDIPAEDISVVSNVFWNPAGQDNFTLCYGDGRAVAPVVRGNVFNGDVILSGNTGSMAFIGNEIYGGELHLRWPRDGSPTAYTFDFNQYYRPNLDLAFFDNNGSYPASVGPNLGSTSAAYERFKTLYQTFRALSNFRPEPHGQYFSSLPTNGARVVVRPNRYEPGRAHIAIVNWAQAPTVTVNISVVGLPVGQQYELRAVQDYFGAKVTGRYDGTPIRVPMTGWPVAQPRFPRETIASTFPAFGTFVLLPLGAAPTAPPAAPTNLRVLAHN